MECIAVIGSGVNSKLYDIGTLQFDMEIHPDLNITTRLGDNLEAPMDSAICAAIIKKYAPDAPIGSIKVIPNEDGRGMSRQLIQALRWCVKNEIKIVNLNLGSTDYRDFAEIRSWVNEFAGQGLIIVAACDHNNGYSTPAGLTNVIGVRCRNIYTNMQYMFTPYAFDGIEISASGRHYLTDAFGKSRYTSPANNFAAPFITALVYQIMTTHPGISLEGIKRELYQGALNYKDNGYNPNICMNADWALESVVIGERGISTGTLDPGGLNTSIECAEATEAKLWDLGYYRMNLQKQMLATQAQIDIPVVAVCASEDTEVFDSLHSRFESDGYYSVKVSTDWRDVLQGCEYLPEDVDAGRFLALVHAKYGCDLILLKTNTLYSVESIGDRVDFGIILQVAANEIMGAREMISLENDAEPILVEISKDGFQEQVNKVYHKMLELFQFESLVTR